MRILKDFRKRESSGISPAVLVAGEISWLNLKCCRIFEVFWETGNLFLFYLKNNLTSPFKVKRDWWSSGLFKTPAIKRTFRKNRSWRCSVFKKILSKLDRSCFPGVMLASTTPLVIFRRIFFRKENIHFIIRRFCSWNCQLRAEFKSAKLVFCVIQVSGVTAVQNRRWQVWIPQSAIFFTSF